MDSKVCENSVSSEVSKSSNTIEGEPKDMKTLSETKIKKEPVYHPRALSKWEELERRGLIKKTNT